MPSTYGKEQQVVAVLPTGSPPVPPPAISATLDELRARPAELEGKRVRVAGQTTQCWNFSCSLCPTEAIPAEPRLERCLALDFDRMTGAGGDGSGFLFGTAYRFADVVLTAHFSSACLRAGSCLDNATVLGEAVVERVTKRLHSRDGLVEGGTEPLTLASPTVAAPLIATAHAAMRNSEHEAFRVFTKPDDPTMSASAIVCRYTGYETPADNAWPDTAEAAILWPSAIDQWRCWRAKRASGSWIIEPA